MNNKLCLINFIKEFPFSLHCVFVSRYTNWYLRCLCIAVIYVFVAARAERGTWHNIYFCSILVNEWYARLYRRRNKSNCAQIATIYSNLRKSKRYFFPVGDISPIKRYFRSILANECYARLFQRRNKTNSAQNATFHPILEKKTALILSCWRYFDV